MAKKKEFTDDIKEKAREKIIKENVIEPPKNKVGRPNVVIDYETVEKLAGIMCTQEEISSYLGISVRALQNDKEFMRVYKKAIDTGKMSLRRSQMTLATGGNTTMAIWLGKQYLGQTDKLETKNENTETSESVFNKLSKALKNV